MDNPAKICRFCLFEDANCEERPLVHLFQNYNYEEVTDKIQNCLNVKLTPNDKIPPIMCQACIEKVNYFNDFLELCSKSEKQLARFYGLNRCSSSTTQNSEQIERNVNWISDERIRTACKTESDFSVNYKPTSNQDRRGVRLDRKKSVTVQRGKSTVLLMAQKRKPREKLNEARGLTSPISVRCKFCRKKFASIHDYQQHTKTAHEGEIIHKCGKCDKIFLDQDSCLQHERNHKIQCQICNVQVLSKNIAMHLLKHAEKFRTKPAGIFKTPAPGNHPNHNIVCTICQKTFKSENRLAAHIKKMHETRKIRFSVHKKHRSDNLKYKIQLKKIMKTRTYKCKFCPHKFLALKELQEHMMNHSEIRKKCPKCMRQFLYKKHFDKHILQCFYTPNQRGAPKRTSSLPTVVKIGETKD